MYIDPNAAFRGDQGASQVLGKLYRAQWDDWKTRFAPYIDRLADKAMNPGFMDELSGQALSAVNATYSNVQQGMDMQRQGFGLSLTPQQKAAEQRKMALGQSADGNAAFNNARVSARDLQDQILAGGMGLSSVPQTGQGG